MRNETDRSEAVTDVPLGISNDVGYRQFKVKLETGDMVLSFSDAVTASVGADGRQVGQAGVLRMATELDLREPDEVIPAVVDRITEMFSGNLEQDDTTLLLCPVTDTTPSLRDNLLALCGRILLYDGRPRPSRRLPKRVCCRVAISAA